MTLLNICFEIVLVFVVFWGIKLQCLFMTETCHFNEEMRKDPVVEFKVRIACLRILYTFILLKKIQDIVKHWKILTEA